MKSSDLAGVVLAGGRSSRFGSPKALAELGGRRLIDHVVMQLARVASEVLIATNVPKLFGNVHGARVMRDIVPNMGPLGGIATAFRSTRARRLFVLGCDTIAPAEVLDALIGARRADAVVALDGDRPQYLCAIYSRSILGRIEECIRRRELSIRRALAGTGILFVAVRASSILNINTARDLSRAEAGHAV